MVLIWGTSCHRIPWNILIGIIAAINIEKYLLVYEKYLLVYDSLGFDNVFFSLYHLYLKLYSCWGECSKSNTRKEERNDEEGNNPSLYIYAVDRC
jgi:hypothetical protein